MSCIQYAAQVIISNVVRLMCPPSISGSGRRFHKYVELFCSELFRQFHDAVSESSERIRAMTQGEWNLLDDSIFMCCFIMLFENI